RSASLFLLWLTLAGDQRVEVVVLPGTVDPEIGPEQAFAPKSGFFKHAHRAPVAGDARRLEPVQPECAEGEGRDQPERLGHHAAASESHPHPVADLSRLRDAAPDIADGKAAREVPRGVLEDQEGDARAVLDLLAIALHALAPGVAL